MPSGDRLQRRTFYRARSRFCCGYCFHLLGALFRPNGSCGVCLSVGSARKRSGIRGLRRCLYGDHCSFSHEVVRHIRRIHSRRLRLITLTSLFVNTLSCIREKLRSDRTGVTIVRGVHQHSKCRLVHDALCERGGFGLFI